MHKIIEIFADRVALHTEILALRQQSLPFIPSIAETLEFWVVRQFDIAIIFSFRSSTLHVQTMREEK